MKKSIFISLAIMLLCITGCGKDQKVLECKQYGETSTITVANGKIIKNSSNGEEENVTDEEWQTLKNYYEFSDNATTEDIVNKLKEFNEKIGYNCQIK